MRPVSGPEHVDISGEIRRNHEHATTRRTANNREFQQGRMRTAWGRELSRQVKGGVPSSLSARSCAGRQMLAGLECPCVDPPLRSSWC